LPRQCTKRFILCMFYAKRNSTPVAEPLLQANLNILTAQWTALHEWSNPDLRAPYWRLYWNEAPGAYVVEGKRRMELTPGRFFLIPPETSFASCTRKPVRHFYVHFLTSRPWSMAGIQTLPAAESEQRVVQTLMKEDQAALFGWEVSALVAALLARLPDNGWGNTPDRGSRIRAAIQTIDAQTPAPVSVSSLAHAASMNLNAFIRLFRERTGVTPALYARERRIEFACLLLHHSERNIEEIAATCGFCDRYHFTRAFSRSRGVSPAAFRRQIPDAQ